jgi:hypothetical protein
MLTKVFIIIWLHFIADFVLQSSEMGVNKSKDVKWLATHAAIYTIPFIWFGWKFALITGISHFCIDGITSRVTSYFWKKQEGHWFFTTIGWDQAMHMSIFMLLLKYNI